MFDFILYCPHARRDCRRFADSGILTKIGGQMKMRFVKCTRRYEASSPAFCFRDLSDDEF